MNLWEQAKRIPQGVQTLREWLGEDGICVSQELAQKRADCCNQCPQNLPSNPAVAAVADAIRRHVEFKNSAALRVDGEKNLGTCQICACHLRTKIWLPIGLIRRHMPPDQWELFPTPCFQRDETP